MNRDIYLDGQQKIELGQKQKKELNEESEKANKRCRDLLQKK